MKNINDHLNYVDKIIEVFSDIDNAIGIFDELNLGKFDEIQSVQKYQRNDGRKGVVLSIKERVKRYNTTICIDIKEGLPSTRQLSDVVDGAGKDSGIRFIIFSTLKDEKEEEDLKVGFDLVKRLVADNNQKGLNIYLVNFFEPMPDDDWLHFYVYSEPPNEISLWDQYLPMNLGE